MLFSQLQLFQFYNKYSRFDHELGRRETWEEAIDRTVNFLRELSENKLDDATYKQIRKSMVNMEAFPSMRLFSMAGQAARRDNTVIYNCGYVALDSLDVFREIMLLLLAGTGVGFSVETHVIDKLPKVEEQNGMSSQIVIEDSAEGWARALDESMHAWFSGRDVRIDYSLIRPAGSPLKTKGGVAGGSEPLEKSMEEIRRIVLGAQGRKLKSIECHDIATLIGECVVSGGVRRSAMISLFSDDDEDMINAKSGKWWKEHLNRAMANNSMVITGKTTKKKLRELFSMIFNGGGEPGLFFRHRKIAPRREERDDWGTNPCGEVLLRPASFCNLSQAIIRPSDNFTSMLQKVEIATIIGTIQSMATNFPHLRSIWKQNAEEERLLGVDITGQMDNPELLTPQLLTQLRTYAIRINKTYASILGINQSAGVTCVKPSGNSSVLFDCSPGLHTRWSEYYIRRARINAKSPIRFFLEYHGVELSPENGQDTDNATTMVVSFPVKSPEHAIVNGDRSAIEQCEWWLRNKVNYTEHNPSVTILFKETEINDLVNWVYDNQQLIGGMAFLPKDTTHYPQAPYERISEDKYNELVNSFPELDWSLLPMFEATDMTEIDGGCASLKCEI